MADFPLLLNILVFDLKKLDAPQIKSQTMGHTLTNLVNKTLFEKICEPIIKNEHLWICTKYMCLHIPVSLTQPRSIIEVNE